jgi:Tetratricopeptide repeat
VAVTDLGRLALDVLARGDVEAARALLRHSVAVKQAALGPDHPSLGDDLANLGNLLAELQTIIKCGDPLGI